MQGLHFSGPYNVTIRSIHASHPRGRVCIGKNSFFLRAAESAAGMDARRCFSIFLSPILSIVNIATFRGAASRGIAWSLSQN
jgi:hypothetical protein